MSKAKNRPKPKLSSLSKYIPKAELDSYLKNQAEKLTKKKRKFKKTPSQIKKEIAHENEAREQADYEKALADQEPESKPAYFAEVPKTVLRKRCQ